MQPGILQRFAAALPMQKQTLQVSSRLRWVSVTKLLFRPLQCGYNPLVAVDFQRHSCQALANLKDTFMFKKTLTICLLSLALPLASPTHAATVLPLTLDEIIDTSTVAFQGTCIANRTERDTSTNFVVTYTTFDVTDVIKGDVKTTHTIKQIGGIMPADEISFRVRGIPTFAVGQDYVVFLAGVSSAGFSSPIGLGQGQFTVRQGPTGRTVTNGRDFREMTSTVQLVTDASGRQLGLDEFKELARARTRSRP